MEAQFDRAAGAALMVAAAATVLMMAHHPTGHGGWLGQFVHGAMIALLGLATYGLLHVALRRGIERPMILMGAIAYGIALVGHVGAATINGFAVPAMAAHPGIDHGLFVVTWELNQALARLGVVANGIAFLLWSYGFVVQRGWARGLGALGIIAGAAPIVLLGTGAVQMNVAGAMIVYSAQAAWLLLLGLYLWSGRFEAERG